MPQLSRLACLAALSAVACSDGAMPDPDDGGAPGPDAHSSDAASPDAATGPDAGLEVDAGGVDGGDPPDGGEAPRDPMFVEPTVATTVFDSMGWLTEGDDPLQTGLTETIERHRAAVIGGVVRAPGGAPLEGVRVHVIGHPEFGRTRSRADGRYDMLVHGGGVLRITLSKEGYIPASRTVHPKWDEWVLAAPTILVPFDDQVTRVDLSRTDVPMQMHRGSRTDDARGPRQATMLIPMGTTATVTLPDGSQTALPNEIDLRLTEVTVGPEGLDRMPGELPDGVSYTYAVEVTIEQADAMEAVTVDFDRPQPIYVENFLGHDVGTVVPHGQFSVITGKWEPQPDGLVVRIEAVNAGRATLVVDDSGQSASPAQLADLGISDAELDTLGGLYPAGTELWRVPLVRMTSLADFNFSYFCQPSCPQSIRAEVDASEETMCTIEGSIIDVSNQAVGEQVPIVGTPYRLTYKSNRVRGYRAAYQVEIDPYADRGRHPDALALRTFVDIAGQRIGLPTQTLPDGGRLYAEWNGRDGLGRLIQGPRLGTAWVAYGVRAYRGCWAPGTCSGDAFMQGCSLSPCGGDRPDVEVNLRTDVALGLHDYTQRDLGGWGLDAQHVYDPVRRQLYRGDGDIRTVASLGLVSRRLVNVSGGGAGEKPVVGPDGSIWVVRAASVLRILPDGTEVHVAGDLNQRNGYDGDGGRATEALLNQPNGLALREDGALLIADQSNDRVRIVHPDGTIGTFAGTGERGNYNDGDGLPATQANLHTPEDVAIAPDGSVYITTRRGLRRVLTDGTILTVTGGPTLPPTAPVVPATSLDVPNGPVVVDELGRAYVTIDYGGGWLRQIWRIDPTGEATHIAGRRCRGSGCPSAATAEGQLATEVGVNSVYDLAIAPSGELLVVMPQPAQQIWVIDGDDGRVGVLLGGGTVLPGREDHPRSLNGNLVGGLDVAPDGRLVYTRGNRIFELTAPYSGLEVDEHIIPSRDGREIYVFDLFGTHQRTLDARTGVELRRFGYDAGRRLATVTERGGRVTRFTRDADGKVSSIVGPYGATTQLAHDADGLLERVTDPASQVHAFTYHSAAGLLATYTDPRQGVHRFDYDPETGHLIRDTNPDDEATALARSELPEGRAVRVTSAEGLETTYTLDRGAGGRFALTTRFPDGTENHLETTPGFQARLSRADGAEYVGRMSIDPRFGASVPRGTSAEATFPSGLVATMSRARTVTLDPPGDRLAVVDREDRWTRGGGTWVRAWTQDTLEEVWTSPEGRTARLRYDADGHLVERTIPGLAPARWQWSGGRLDAIELGDPPQVRTVSFAYDARGRLTDVTDPRGRAETFGYDDADRPVLQVRRDGRMVGARYDASGNQVAVTPPSRMDYEMGYTGTHRLMSVDPPDPAMSAMDATVYTYDDDRRIDQITRPGQILRFGYNGLGQLERVVSADGDKVGTYHPTTGQLERISGPSAVAFDIAYDGPYPRSVAWSGVVTGSIAVAYDDALRLTSTQLAGQPAVTYAYDRDGLRTRAGPLDVVRSPDHGLVDRTEAGAVITDWDFTPYGELERLATTVSGVERFAHELERDDAGRVTQRIERAFGAARTFVYDYDLAGRLEAVRVDGVERYRYVWDDNGNLSQATDPGGSASGAYDDRDRLVTFGGASYAYAGDGTLRTVDRGAAGTTTYHYDGFGNLRQVDLPNAGGQIRYAVDGADRRVAKLRDGVLERGWLYHDQRNPVAELDASGAVVAEFVYGARANVPEIMLRGGRTYRLVSDLRGSVRAVIDVADGAVAQRLDYDPLGRVVEDTNPGFQPFGFAGGLYDPDTGLVRLGARDYDATTARWTAPDPILFGGGDVNLYGYALRDPVGLVDVDGLTVHAAGVNFSACVVVCFGFTVGGYNSRTNGQSGWGMFTTTSIGLSSNLSLSMNGVFGTTPDDEAGVDSLRGQSCTSELGGGSGVVGVSGSSNQGPTIEWLNEFFGIEDPPPTYGAGVGVGAGKLPGQQTLWHNITHATPPRRLF